MYSGTKSPVVPWTKSPVVPWDKEFLVITEFRGTESGGTTIPLLGQRVPWDKKHNF